MSFVHWKRFFWLLLSLTVMGVALWVLLSTMRESLHLYQTPSAYWENPSAMQRVIRMGGVVQKGSWQREGLQSRFVMTDFSKSVEVYYQGALPDLFREGQGVVASGSFSAPGVFQAQQIFAKHDETYQRPKYEEKA